ncbi:MAG: CBS domain-containing protein [Candidatus Peregrinibacteria bacterium]|nr:CBS domain-containing protein [Candidatus Peregrinibacteria bacterium]
MQKKVSEFMTTEVISVSEDDALKNVFKLMDKHGILGVPVVDGSGGVIGMVTESDLIKHFTTLNAPIGISILGSIVYLNNLQDFNEHLKDHSAERVGDMMTKEVVTVMQNFTLLECINIMAEKSLNRLPVVDEVGKLVGIVTRSDIVHQLAKLKTP